jgi:hypothetical protein
MGNEGDQGRVYTRRQLLELKPAGLYAGFLEDV